MPLPGTSGKIPAIRKTVTGQRLYTAKLRDRMMTSTVAKKIETGSVVYGRISLYQIQPQAPAMPQYR